MWDYAKKLQYPVKIKNPDPVAAKIIMTQLGGLSHKKIYSLKLHDTVWKMSCLCG